MTGPPRGTVGPGAQLKGPAHPLGAASVGCHPPAQRTQPGEVSPSAPTSSALAPHLEGTPSPHVDLFEDIRL